jgi:hypothetical protein
MNVLTEAEAQPIAPPEEVSTGMPLQEGAEVPPFFEGQDFLDSSVVEAEPEVEAVIEDSTAEDVEFADQTDVTEAEDTEKEQVAQSRLKKFGKALIARVGVEGVGIALDAAMIAVGASGLSGVLHGAKEVFRNQVSREGLAAIADIGLYDLFRRLLDSTKTAEASLTPRHIKFAKAAGHLAAGAAVAVVAQKVGLEAASHIQHGLTDGAMHEYVVPIGSKVPAMMAYSAVTKRTHE